MAEENENKNMEKKEEKDKITRGFQQIVEYLINTTADIALKAFSGIIIFLILDGLLGFCLSYLGKPDLIYPFFFTKKIYHKVINISRNFGIDYTFLTAYFLFWAWGKIMYILRQPLFLDFLKDEYTTEMTETKEIENFKELRSQTIYELKRELLQLEKKKLGTNSRFTNWKKILKNNDYLLYQVLGKIEAYNKPSTSKRSSEADEIAFIGTNIILTSLILFFSYLFLLLQKKLKDDCSSLLLVVSYSIIAAVFLFFISHIAWRFFLTRVAKRYISRNTRLYINYLLDDKGFIERLKEKTRK